MKQNSFAAASVAGLRLYLRGIKRLIFFSFLLMYLLCSLLSHAQQHNEHGKEAKKSTMNFTEVANHYKLHPQPLKRKELENEEDDEPRPVHPPITDMSLLHRRHTAEAPVSGSTPTPFLPVSSTPADTFESTLDNGTSIPPDTHGAVDGNYCVTTINTAVRIQNRTGGVVSTVTLDQFWLPILSGGGSFDPRVHYDPYTQRWFIVAVSGANSASSAVLIAVSQTSNPTGAWWMYKVTAVPGGAYWLDFPNVGFNKKWLVVTGNLFGSSYGGAKVYVFNKAALMSGAGASYTSFIQSSSFTIAPAITYDSVQNNLFTAESWNGNYGYMHISKISGAVGAETMTSVGYPVSSQPWQTTSYAVSGSSGADFAPQLGSTSKLQTNDDRVTQAIFMNNKLWFAHTVFLPYSTTANATRSSVQWWQTDTLANPLQIGRIDDNTNVNFFAFPTIAVNTSDDALIGFSTFSAGIHPSAAYALRLHTDPIDSMRPLVVYKHGSNTYYKTYGGAKDRWGDYSGTCLDPVNRTDFWTIQEVSSATANVWDTWWAHVVLNSCSVAAISGVSTLCARASATYTDATSGGTWSSSSPSVATISSAGVVTSMTAGVATITYTAPGGCTATKTITINPLPTAGTISGLSTVTTGTTITLTDAVAGGTWSSSNPSVATISSSGIVTGVAAGSANITYTVTNSCGSATAVAAITVTTAFSNRAPYFTGGASQSLSICQNAAPVPINSLMTIYDADASQTETWSVSSAPAHGTLSGFPTSAFSTGSTLTPAGLAYVPAAGYSGIDAFTIRISDGYTTASTTVNVVVNPLPSAGTISGPASVATGSSITLTDAVTGGGWSSGNPSVATISSAGVVTGIASGTAVITYAVSNSCGTAYSTYAVSISATASNRAPYFTRGASQSVTVCQNSSALSLNSMLSVNDADAGQTETWSVASAPAHGTLSGFAVAMMSTGGTLTPSALTYTPSVGYAGADAFTIKVSDGYTTATTIVNVTITASPYGGVISGPSTVAAGSSIVLSDAVAGGTWSSSNTAIATVSAMGAVTGISNGNATISYTVANGCGTAVSTYKVRVTKYRAMDPVLSTGTVDQPDATVTVYPNPASGAFVITVPGDGVVSIVSQQGRVVGQYEVAIGANQLGLPSGSPAGIYLLQFSGSDGTKNTVKLMYKP